MKILFVGASGAIGSGVLEQCLAHPKVTTVIAFSRRDLPAAVSTNGKLQCAIKKDFSRWEDDELQSYLDADAMIWNMGTSNDNVAVNLDYPVAFLEAFERLLVKSPERPPFRYVLLGGMFVTQDQDASLWFLEKTRKQKGRLESKALSLAEDQPSRWQVYIAKPGAVLTKGIVGRGAINAVLGGRLTITLDELGATMTEAAVGGLDKDGLLDHGYLVTMGRELLKKQAQSNPVP